MRSFKCHCFLIAVIKNTHFCSSTGEWLDKLGYNYTTEQYSALKRKKTIDIGNSIDTPLGNHAEQKS